jgi:hypothetical protein
MKKTILQEIVGDPAAAEASKAGRERIQRAKRDFGFFCQTYLSDYFFTPPAEYQRILHEVADTRSLTARTAEALRAFVLPKYQDLLKPSKRLDGALFVEPREHGKTVRWCFAYTLWRVLSGKTRYALIIGATGTAASENLINIRIELEENEKLIEDFGDQKGERWSDTRIELALGACIQSKGAGMSMRGTRFRQYRPDIIILDDLLKDDAVESPTTRAKIHRWLKRVVFNLGKTAFLVWVNTIFHSDDPVSRVLAEISDGTLPDWAAVRLSCWRPNGDPLWPEMWSREDLEKKRIQIGSDNFSAEYENEPLSEEERIIKRDWIELNWYGPAEMPAIETMRRFAGVDPSSGKHDQQAVVTVGVDKKGILWELDSWGKTCSELELVRQLIEKHLKWRYELIGWEETNFSAIYANYVISLCAEQGVHLPIRKIKASTHANANVIRVRSYSPLVENGTLRIRQKGAAELIDQLVGFPKFKFDDLCSGLWYAIHVAARGPGAPMVIPFDRYGILSLARRTLRGYK